MNQDELRKQGIASSLSHQAPGTWQFDEDVAACFRDMLTRSIPDYHGMRHAVTDIARPFYVPTTPIVDLGASLGDAASDLVYEIPDDDGEPPVVLIENAPAMVSRLRDRFARRPTFQVVEHDLTQGLPPCADNASIVLSVLTLQFLTVPTRIDLIGQVWEAMTEGGAFVVVEKCEGLGRIGRVMTEQYHEWKVGRGYSREQVEEKARSLDGVLVPLSARTNEAILRGAGFAQVECFWRAGLFAAWVCVK